MVNAEVPKRSYVVKAALPANQKGPMRKSKGTINHEEGWKGASTGRLGWVMTPP